MGGTSTKESQDTEIDVDKIQQLPHPVYKRIKDYVTQYHLDR